MAETLHGRRRWFVYPPRSRIAGGFNPRMPGAHWFRASYARAAAGAGLRECTLAPGEAIYIPGGWYHATLSLGESVSITTGLEADDAPAGWAPGATFRTWDDDLEEVAQAERDFVAANASKDARAQLRSLGECSARIGSLPVSGRPFAAWALLGACIFLQGDDPAAALDAFDRCAKLNPLFAPCAAWQARAAQALGRKKKAAAQRARAASLSWAGDDQLSAFL